MNELLPYLKHSFHNHTYHLRSRGLKEYLQWNRVKSDTYIKAKLQKNHYNLLNEADIRHQRKSDTVFLFGSGYSLNDIPRQEWDYFTEHDTFGFTTFFYQKWIPMDYHLFRGWNEGYDGIFWEKYTYDVVKKLEDNPCYENTTYFLQSDFSAYFGNALVGYKILKKGTRIFPYKTLRPCQRDVPSLNLRHGVNHSCGTLMDCVNLAFLLGWKNIVLVGVDLYDTRYFYAKGDETMLMVDHKWVASKKSHRGHSWNDPHHTTKAGVVEIMEAWAAVFHRHGVALEVYNPKSLLTKVIPVYSRKEGR